MNSDIELNEHGTNKAIKFNILSDTEMKTAGFRLIIDSSLYGDYWCLCKFLQNEITFNVHILADGSDGWIDVIDEDFGQPYDYQYILEKDSYHPFANYIREEVEHWMKMLTDAGII